MPCHQVELSDRSFTLLDEYARDRGIDYDQAVERAVAVVFPHFEPNGHNGHGAASLVEEEAPAKPLLTFHRQDELGDYFERILDHIESGTCDQLVREMEADYARLLLKAEAQSR